MSSIESGSIVTETHRRSDNGDQHITRLWAMPQVAAIVGVSTLVMTCATLIWKASGIVSAAENLAVTTASNEKRTTESLKEIKQEVKEVKETVSKQGGDIAEIRARQTVIFLQQAQAPQRQKGTPP